MKNLDTTDINNNNSKFIDLFHSSLDMTDIYTLIAFAIYQIHKFYVCGNATTHTLVIVGDNELGEMIREILIDLSSGVFAKSDYSTFSVVALTKRSNAKYSSVQRSNLFIANIKQYWQLLSNNKSKWNQSLQINNFKSIYYFNGYDLIENGIEMVYHPEVAGCNYWINDEDKCWTNEEDQCWRNSNYIDKMFKLYNNNNGSAFNGHVFSISGTKFSTSMEWRKRKHHLIKTFIFEKISKGQFVDYVQVNLNE